MNIGAVMYSQGDLHGAKDLFRKSLEVYTRIFPPDHPDLQRARVNLAGTLTALGDLHGAQEHLKKAVEICKRAFPDTHPDLLMARLNLASILFEIGDPCNARTLQEKILEAVTRGIRQGRAVADVQKRRSHIHQTGNRHRLSAFPETARP